VNQLRLKRATWGQAGGPYRGFGDTAVWRVAWDVGHLRHSGKGFRRYFGHLRLWHATSPPGGYSPDRMCVTSPGPHRGGWLDCPTQSL
jgi:hypothetical protein